MAVNIYALSGVTLSVFRGVRPFYVGVVPACSSCSEWCHWAHIDEPEGHCFGVSHQNLIRVFCGFVPLSSLSVLPVLSGLCVINI